MPKLNEKIPKKSAQSKLKSVFFQKKMQTKNLDTKKIINKD